MVNQPHDPTVDLSVEPKGSGKSTRAAAETPTYDLAPDSDNDATEYLSPGGPPTQQVEVTMLLPGSGSEDSAEFDFARLIEQDQPYARKNVHAKGGFGQVWLARDSRLNRDVALKELLPDRKHEMKVVQGFLKEAQVTAQLEHPNIVPVYQFGAAGETGQPYYTMKMVRGQTLDDAIADDHRGSSRHPLRRRRLLNAFTAVCYALAYAHSRGVVHRDLKPQNIVLGDFGEVIVLDWGLAKLVGEPETDSSPARGDAGDTQSISVSGEVDANKTQAGQVMGTPGYMAPEQAAGDVNRIDAKIDVYALGGILFCILTGKPPHRNKDVIKLLLSIIDGPTPQVRQLVPRASAALNAIAAKAMAKSPDDRYANATDLAHDVERWLANEPVSAYREPLPTRMLRWAKRHKSLVAASGALLMTAMLGLLISTVLIRGEQRRTQAALDRAESNFRTSLAAVEEMLKQVGQEDLKNVPQMEQVRQDLLEKALQFYRGFLKEKPRNPGLRFEMARTYHQVGRILQILERHDEAAIEFRHAMSLCEELATVAPPSAEYRRQWAVSGIDLGETQRLTGQAEDAQQSYAHAESLLQQLLDKDYKNSESQFDDRRELARAVFNHGILLHDTNQPVEAQDAFKRAADLLGENVGRQPDDENSLQQLARVFINLGSLLKDLEQPKEAEATYQMAIERYQRLIEISPDSRNYREELAVAHTNLGNLLLTVDDRIPDAVVAFETSLELIGKLAAESPNVPNYQNQRARTLNSLGSVFLSTDRQRAERHWREALEIYRRLTKDYPRRAEYQSMHGAAAGNLGYALMLDDAFSPAVAILEEAIEHQQKALKINPDNVSHRQFLYNQFRALTEVWLRQGDHERASLTASRIAESPWATWQDTYRAARYTARCVALAADANAPLAAEQYATRTIALLQASIDAGLTQLDQLQKQAEFEPLRERVDFKSLLNRAKSAAASE